MVSLDAKRFFLTNLIKKLHCSNNQLKDPSSQEFDRKINKNWLRNRFTQVESQNANTINIFFVL
jgi:hypothetical protein